MLQVSRARAPAGASPRRRRAALHQGDVELSARIAIIDSGGSNIASLTAALARLGVRSVLTDDPAAIRSAGHVILPGVGAAADAMQRLRKKGLASVVPTLTQPVLGICLGMHLLAEHSDENDAACLGIFPASAALLPGSAHMPVPNMGWCRLTRTADHPLLDGIESGSWFYFVHSYALPVAGFTIAAAEHALPITAAGARGNFVATQFHPERSGAAGARLLANFLSL